ncbi:hypothetical protein PUN28_004366 [Cardiocondyla obscurior]|uniref:HTH CENPB-type domain-containing protein n=1 Tax=Cardiocondyla obscurior TaxID=286306 RepID=A0AAW2GD09_9HYME
MESNISDEVQLVELDSSDDDKALIQDLKSFTELSDSSIYSDEDKEYHPLDQSFEKVKRRNDDELKNNFTNAFIYCKNLFEMEDLITDEPPEYMSDASIAMGEEFFKEIMYMLEDRKVVTEENLIFTKHKINKKKFEEPGENSEDVDCIERRQSFTSYENVPLFYKKKVVAIAEKHPRWTLETFQKKGYNRLKSKNMLRLWIEDVKQGGTHIDKWRHIETRTFEFFQEAKENFEQVTTRTLQQWAMAIALPFLTNKFNFSASRSWAERFKSKYKIRSRKMTKYVSNKEYDSSWEEVLRESERFQAKIKAIMLEFDFNFIINTSQMEFQHQMLIAPVLKTFPLKRKLQEEYENTYFYTLQFSITASGKMLPVVFLCMREPTGKFNFATKKKINKLMSYYKNVFVTCSKSGKMTNLSYINYLKYCLSPYVEKNKFLLLVDSLGSQPVDTYDEIFEDELGRTSCSVKVIPSKCVSFCHPCNKRGYFCYQIKSFVKRFHNFPGVYEKQEELQTLEGVIKLHSLLLHQLSAPVFEPMILYAWFASKLIEDEPKMINIKDICFPVEILKNLCSCNNVGFIRCAHCNLILCIDCFYDLYHPKTCNLVLYKKEISDNSSEDEDK